MFNRRILFVAATVAALAGCATHSTPASVADTIAAKPQLSTLNGLIAKAGEFVTVEEVMVQTADISATNGVVHIVDSVLIPPATR